MGQAASEGWMSLPAEAGEVRIDQAGHSAARGLGRIAAVLGAAAAVALAAVLTLIFAATLAVAVVLRCDTFGDPNLHGDEGFYHQVGIAMGALNFFRSLASAYSAVGRDADAQRVLKSALDLPFPTGAKGVKVETQLQYASLLQQANRLDQAGALFRQVLAADVSKAEK